MNVKKNHKFEILCIGRFAFEKSHALIVETCKDLRDNDIDFHLTLKGEGPLLEDIKNMIKNYRLENNITVIDEWVDRDEIPLLVGKSDLYIQPSLTEGLPLAVLEAMSMGKPVVVTKAGGMPELIKDKGAILIEKNNKKQLYDAILYYIKNPQDVKIGGQINSKFVRDTFNWDKHARKLYDVYTELMNK